MDEEKKDKLELPNGKQDVSAEKGDVEMTLATMAGGVTTQNLSNSLTWESILPDVGTGPLFSLLESLAKTDERFVTGDFLRATPEMIEDLKDDFAEGLQD
jgi:hypothetical protein